MMFCASCGIAEIDHVKLVPCDGCDLVRYCSDDCRENHKLEHREECKKRVAVLLDEILFKQPECSYLGDCPICCLPLPIDMTKSSMCYSCSKVICYGCIRANKNRQTELRLEQTCLFCRKPNAKTEEERDKQMMKRVEVNDPVALSYEGWKQRQKGEYSSAFEYFTRAAKLGSVDAHFRLAWLYYLGRFVEKDEGKYIHHLEEAAIGGHPHARYNLGAQENNNGNVERAVKHWIIAARQGDDDSIKMLMEGFKQGFVEKDLLASALRAHKAAVDATKSTLREEAEVPFNRNGRW